MFFKCFYDWDRERRLNIKLRNLRNRQFYRLVRNVFTKKLDSYFEILVSHEEEAEPEFDRDKAF